MMKTFKQFIKELNVSGPGGVLGDYTDTGGSVGNVDSYAKGDARLPVVLGTFTRAGKRKQKNKKKKNEFRTLVNK